VGRWLEAFTPMYFTLAFIRYTVTDFLKMRLTYM
jgi:hypothetical protein